VKPLSETAAAALSRGDVTIWQGVSGYSWAAALPPPPQNARRSTGAGTANPGMVLMEKAPGTP